MSLVMKFGPWVSTNRLFSGTNWNSRVISQVRVFITRLVSGKALREEIWFYYSEGEMGREKDSMIYGDFVGINRGSGIGFWPLSKTKNHQLLVINTQWFVPKIWLCLSAVGTIKPIIWISVSMCTIWTLVSGWVSKGSTDFDMWVGWVIIICIPKADSRITDLINR